jgi:hypothetical protein
MSRTLRPLAAFAMLALIVSGSMSCGMDAGSKGGRGLQPSFVSVFGRSARINSAKLTRGDVVGNRLVGIAPGELGSPSNAGIFSRRIRA